MSKDFEIGIYLKGVDKETGKEFMFIDQEGFVKLMDRIKNKDIPMYLTTDDAESIEQAWNHIRGNDGIKKLLDGELVEMGDSNE